MAIAGLRLSLRGRLHGQSMRPCWNRLCGPICRGCGALCRQDTLAQSGRECTTDRAAAGSRHYGFVVPREVGFTAAASVHLHRVQCGVPVLPGTGSIGHIDEAVEFAQLVR